MIVVTCKNGDRYGFEFDTDVDRMRVTKQGKVRFWPTEGVRATLEFPSQAVTVQEGE